MSYNFVASVPAPPGQSQITPQQALQMISRDPASVMRQAGFNVPTGLTSQQKIVQYLMQTGQAPQSRIMQLLQKLSGARR